MKEEKYNELLDKLIGDLRYELASGIHTYHKCPYCHRYSTRAGKCAVCVVTDFKEKK